MLLNTIKSVFTYDLLSPFKKKTKEPKKLSNSEIKTFFKDVFKNDPEQAAYAYSIYQEAELIKKQKETGKQLDKSLARGKAGIANRYASNFISETLDYGIYGYSTRDEVIQLNGMDEAERSLKDPKVRAAYNVLLSPVFSDSLVVEQCGDEEEAAELKEYIESLMKEVKGTFAGKLKEGVKTALTFQNAFFEIIPKWSENQDFYGKRVIKEFMSKRPGLLEFQTDDYDNVLGLHSLIYDDEYYSCDRFFILSYNNLFSNPYGESLFASYYKFWKAKLIIYQDMAVYANRYSQPIPLVTYNDDTLHPKAQDISDSLYAGVNLALPEGIKVEFAKAIESGANPFIPILEWLDRQISLAICGIDLSQGSYAADKVIQEERALYVKDLQRELEDQLFEQIVKRFISQNFDKDKYPINIYPRISFQEQKEKLSVNDFMNAVNIAATLEAIDTDRLSDKNRIRVMLGFDEISQDEQEEYEEIEVEEDEEEPEESEEIEDSEDDEKFSFEKITDFPEKGDNKKVSLRNSNYPLFDNQYAKNLKENYPEIWKLGGNVRGSEAFNLAQKALKGDYTPAVIDWIKEREAWAARHKDNFRIAGVIAQVKWLVISSKGESYMKNLIKEEIEKRKD